MRLSTRVIDFLQRFTISKSSVLQPVFSFPMLFSANTKIVMHPEQSYGAFKEADALLSCAIFGSDLELV